MTHRDEAVGTPRVGVDPAAALQDLLEVMRRLRDPQGGCPWDLAQDFASIAPHTLEEAYEVVDAIERGAPPDIRDELGDLLFQVVFHARLGEERGWFAFGDVAAGIAAKLRRRHPHVFGEGAATDVAAQGATWERIKAEERGAGGDDAALAGVARSLPALSRAAKLGKRAGRVGFDWPDAAGVRDKVAEELAELDEVLAEAREPAAGESGAGGEFAGAAAEALAARRAEELGDLLFAVANWGRHLGIDPEEALRAANRKFERRFAAVEAAARARNRPLETLTAPEWDALWVEAKRGA
jgi:nucleoside triphosphate diphosphatase